MSDLRCSYCQQPIERQHTSDCIFSLGRPIASPPPVTGAQCNRPMPKVEAQEERDARAAKVVREAFRAIAEETNYVGWWSAIAERESDAVLLKLRRLLK